MIEFDSGALPDGMELEITHKVEHEPGEDQGYHFLDYVFVFPNDRLVAARTYLSTFAGRTEIGFCGCWDGDDGDNKLGDDCLQWPEFRQSVIALKAMGFEILLWPGAEEYEEFDLTRLKIEQAEIDAWATSATAAATNAEEG